MDYDKEINSLAAENLTMHAVLTHILFEIGKSDQKMSEAIARGFDNAETFLEALALKHGPNVSPDHLARTLKIVADLRTGALGRSATPTPKRDV